MYIFVNTIVSFHALHVLHAPLVQHVIKSFLILETTLQNYNLFSFCYPCPVLVVVTGQKMQEKIPFAAFGWQTHVT